MYHRRRQEILGILILMNLLGHILSALTPQTIVTDSRGKSSTPVSAHKTAPSTGGNLLEKLLGGLTHTDIVASRPQVLAAETHATPTPTAMPTDSPTPTMIPTSTPVPHPKDFWDHFTNLIREKSKAQGFNADVLIRQKALESAFGTSDFAQNRNNFGGVGAYDSDPNNAFSYDSPESYLDAYFKLIKERYPDAYAHRADPKQYVTDLKAGGYASDPQYVWKVLNTPLSR